MKSLVELDHYDVLEVARDAGRQEIERAYALARVTWAEGSLATYSLFDSTGAEEVRERMELAYRVLSDPDARRRYDDTLEEEPREEGAIELAFDLEPAPPAAPELGAEIAGLDDPEDEGELVEYGGARLRRARLRRGLELERIAEITKVNPTYLRFLEEDYYSGLPAPVYVRGFVTLYARCVGLDPHHVAASYMQRYYVTTGGDEGGRPRRPR